MLHKPRPVPSWICGEHSGMVTGFCRVRQFSRNSVSPSTVFHTHSLNNHRRRIIFAPVNLKNRHFTNKNRRVLGRDVENCSLNTEQDYHWSSREVLGQFGLLYSGNRDPCLETRRPEHDNNHSPPFTAREFPIRAPSLTKTTTSSLSLINFEKMIA